MVRLYKDPGGDKVFTAHEDAAQVTAVLPPAAAQSQAGESDIDHLNRKIERLESTIAEYMVYDWHFNDRMHEYIHNTPEDDRCGFIKEVDVDIKWHTREE